MNGLFSGQAGFIATEIFARSRRSIAVELRPAQISVDNPGYPPLLESIPMHFGNMPVCQNRMHGKLKNRPTAGLICITLEVDERGAGDYKKPEGGFSASHFFQHACDNLMALRNYFHFILTSRPSSSDGLPLSRSFNLPVISLRSIEGDLSPNSNP